MILDEPTVEDHVYDMDGYKFIINKEEQKEISFLEIDFVNDWSGKEFTVTAGF